MFFFLKNLRNANTMTRCEKVCKTTAYRSTKYPIIKSKEKTYPRHKEPDTYQITKQLFKSIKIARYES